MCDSLRGAALWMPYLYGAVLNNESCSRGPRSRSGYVWSVQDNILLLSCRNTAHPGDDLADLDYLNLCIPCRSTVTVLIFQSSSLIVKSSVSRNRAGTMTGIHYIDHLVMVTYHILFLTHATVGLRSINTAQTW
jgi:hypothetical protein